MKKKGQYLNEKNGVGACHALFHQDGHFYNHLTKFPGAFFDPNGYVWFESENDYKNCISLAKGEKRVNVRGGISSMPRYIKFD